MVRQGDKNTPSQSGHTTPAHASASRPATRPSSPAGDRKVQPSTIVIKLGTSSIVAAKFPYPPRLQLSSSIVETVVGSRASGHKVVLVSSGAIGVGLRHMGSRDRGKQSSRKQASAAIGQGRSIASWDNSFAQSDQPIAQISLTRADISDRTRYSNAQNTMKELITMGVVPIVNENDTVSVSEIKFGDNDSLSAITSNIVHADYSFLSTDVDCMYTDNPRVNPEAKAVKVVRNISEIRKEVSTSTSGTSLGTGGMSTKIIAAESATAAGVTTVIMNAVNVKDIYEVVRDGPGPSQMHEDTTDSESGPSCTRFSRYQRALNDRKWWITHGSHVAGTVVIDEGAYRAVGKRESGGRSLPAGVVRVEGPFASHQGVRIVVRRRKRFPPANLLPTPISEAVTPARMSPEHGHDPEYLATSSPVTRARVLANVHSTTSSPDTNPLPGTPQIQPTLSSSSSVVSLDPLSRTGPSSPAMRAVADRLVTTTISASLSDGEGTFSAPAGGQSEEWEEIEVGKGLTQYNSVEMNRIKGMKSSHIEQVLGYSESDHVVESIVLS